MGNGIQMSFAQDGITAASIADEAFVGANFAADAITKQFRGIAVTRAADTLPQTTAEAIFTVSTGWIWLTSIMGVVTTVIQTQANNTKLVANPTTGADVDLCAVLNISADAVGDIYTITGTLSDAMVGAGAVAAAMAKPILVPPGTIDLNCAASNTGGIRWVLHYVPAEAGATVTATAV